MKMNKTMLAMGGFLLALGGAAFLLYVLPWIAGAGLGQGLSGGPVAAGPSALAVVLATFGLAAGSALRGIGLGWWKRPRPLPHDGSPEV